MTRRRRWPADPRERLLYLFAEKFALDDNGCWVWIASTSPRWGYGLVNVPTGIPGMKPSRGRQAHRVAYELFVGPVAEGLDLDHLCRVRACVNPAHLEPVTRRENLLRGDTLARAHAEGRNCGFDKCPGCARFRRAAA